MPTNAEEIADLAADVKKALRVPGELLIIT